MKKKMCQEEKKAWKELKCDNLWGVNTTGLKHAINKLKQDINVL